MDNFRITIASLPDREHVVAEILYKNIQWVEISQEANDLVIQFYSHPTEKYWEFSFDDAMKALEEAKTKLLN